MELNYEDNRPKVTVNVNTILSQRNSPATATKEESFVNKNLLKRKRSKTACFGSTKDEHAKRMKKNEQPNSTEDKK